MAKKKKGISKVISFKNESVIFDKEDFQIMDLALKYNPELRLSAGVLKRFKKSKIKYPIKSFDVMLKLMPKSSFRIEGHHFNEKFVKRYMRQEYFPINDDSDLINKCYLALISCKEDISWAARAPENGRELLIEYSKLTKTVQ